ncbi:Outer membrane protein (OmpH-like) [Roseovarius litorisediminis]|uniref:Outer membrane protein (OmpH-like) n=1 Tax=Roseovarius litorisediminis TaxID=1312363 RepID=A0A1Y5R974_9RHOB|nr:OmpH family outer membrane protein [Roseovarius litorisediminis]SLN12094.1 Outer membrane protein (OmpH-like) [Roseovarius litorisediminis]
MLKLMRIVGLVGILTCLTLGPAQAQEIGVVRSEILILDSERLLTETLLGQRLTADLQAERDKLIARNRKIETELEAEEQALTDLRSQKSPEEFRALADSFDTKVQEIRRDSERAARDLERNRELAPVQFMRMAEPVLVQVMQEAGGSVILERRGVLLSSDAINITDLAIVRINKEIGDGLPRNPTEDTDPSQTSE